MEICHIPPDGSGEPSICFESRRRSGGALLSSWHIPWRRSRVLLAVKRFPFRELTRPLRLRGRAFEDDCVVVGWQLDKLSE